MSRNWAFTLDTADPEALEVGIKDAPHYDARVANALNRTIRVIHGLADFHRRRGLQLSEFEIYLGRCGGSAEHLLDRWQTHHKTKGHKWGTVLFTCRTVKAARLEGLAIKVLNKLHAENALCVSRANVSNGGGGGTANTQQSIIYMTWSTDGDGIDADKPNKQLINEIAVNGEIATGGDVSREQISRGLATLKRLSEYDELKLFTGP